MTFKSGLILSLGLLLAACGGDDGDGNLVDAPTGNDAIGNGCIIADNLGTIAPVVTPGGQSMGTPTDPWFVEVKAPFNDAQFPQLPDWFVLRMFDETSLFPQDLTPGTFQIQGDELNHEVCGMCVLLVGDSSGDRADETNNAYVATSGSITVDSVFPTFSATLTNATFQHVIFTVPQSTHIPNPSGCTTSVSSLTVTADIEPLVGNVAGLMSMDVPENGRIGARLKR